MTAAEARLDRADVLVELGRWTEARAELAAALAADPDSFRAHCLMGACLLALDEPGDALDAAAIAIRLRPDDEWGFRIRSVAFGRLGRHEDAVAAAREAVRVEPDDPLPHARLAKALLALPDGAEEAGAAVERALALDPDRVSSHLLAAQVADALGDVDEERAAYERTLRLDPENAEAVNGLAALDNEHIRFGSALRHQAGALALDPTEPVFRQNLETMGRNLVATGVVVTTAAALPLGVLGGLEAVGVDGWWWLRSLVGLAAVVTYALFLRATTRGLPSGVRRHLRRTILGLPATQPRFTFLLVVPMWVLLVAAALLPPAVALVASGLLVGFFVAARAGYPDRGDDEEVGVDSGD